ncbi:MAG: helix-turn-helix transcriptional regulator [Methylocystis sp.]
MSFYDIFTERRGRQMTEYLTTRELAALLRVKQRKVYDLVADEALPFRRVTGKLLFPKREIEEWIGASGSEMDPSNRRARATDFALVMAGGHDPLLDWALRESRSGIAALMDGALDGLARMQEKACIAAGLHIPASNFEEWNIAAVRKSFDREPVALLEWAKRTRGLMYSPKLMRSIKNFRDIGDLRFQSRQPEAGSELVLTALLSKERLRKSDLKTVEAIERSETDLAMAIASGRADVGLGIEAAARQFQLEFTPMVVERFDLLVWRKPFFDPPFQRLMRFCASAQFKERASALGGYDCADLGLVHFNGP